MHLHVRRKSGRLLLVLDLSCRREAAEIDISPDSSTDSKSSSDFFFVDFEFFLLLV